MLPEHREVAAARVRRGSPPMTRLVTNPAEIVRGDLTRLLVGLPILVGIVVLVASCRDTGSSETPTAKESAVATTPIFEPGAVVTTTLVPDATSDVRTSTADPSGTSAARTTPETDATLPRTSMDWLAQRELERALGAPPLIPSGTTPRSASLPGPRSALRPAPGAVAMQTTSAVVPPPPPSFPSTKDHAETSFQDWYATREQASTQPVPAKARGRRLHVEAGADWTSSYYFRGLVQERDGFIIQPYLELHAQLSEPDAPVDVTAILGTWSSVHSDLTDPGTEDDTLEHWYETDLYATIELGLDDWTFSTTYWLYLSPSDAFDTVQEIEGALEYDDASWWDNGFALNPSARLGVEISGVGNDGLDRGTYFEVGLRPAWQVEAAQPLEISVPMTVGLSFHEYFQNEQGEDSTFGFFEVGVEASMDLPGDGAYGTWSLTGGLHWLFLGDTTEEINDGRGDELIGSFGVGVSF